MNVSSLAESGIFKQEGLQDFLLPYGQYEKIAFRMIDKYASPEAYIMMTRDDDAIYFVTHKLIIASCQWYNSDKCYTYRGYLSRHGKWAVQTWSTQQERQVGRQWEHMELSVIKSEDQPPVENIIADKIQTQKDKQLNDQQYIEKLMKNAYLNARQIKFLHMKYWENMNNTQIASKAGVTRERIRQIVQLALNRLREVALGRFQ